MLKSLTEFYVTDYCDVSIDEQGIQNVSINPHDMYPATIARIQYVLSNSIFPDELLQKRFDDSNLPLISTDRARRLLTTARALPATAWQDALLHRSEFTSITGYAPPGKRNSLEIYSSKLRPDIQRLWQRGDALETALGWFLQALRCSIGGSNNRITTGLSGGDLSQHRHGDLYHYQL